MEHSVDPIVQEMLIKSLRLSRRFLIARFSVCAVLGFHLINRLLLHGNFALMDLFQFQVENRLERENGFTQLSWGVS